MANMCAQRCQALAVIHAVLVAALAFNAAVSDANTGWAPLETRSGPVLFSPDFSGQYSSEKLSEALRMVADSHGSMRTRSHGTQRSTDASPFASSPTIVGFSVNEDKSQ